MEWQKQPGENDFYTGQIKSAVQKSSSQNLWARCFLIGFKQTRYHYIHKKLLNNLFTTPKFNKIKIYRGKSDQ